MIMMEFNREHKIEDFVRNLMHLRNTGHDYISFDMIEKDSVLLINPVKKEN